MTEPVLKQWMLHNGISCFVYNSVYFNSDDEKQTIYCSLTLKRGSLADDSKRGIAHFTEHMLLGLNSNICDERSEYDILGTTSLDRTNYTIQCFSENIEGALKILQKIFCKKYLDKSLLFKTQKDVLHEFFEKQSNGEVGNITQLLIQRGIQNPNPIGKIFDIQNFSFDDVAAFYKREYIPSNIALVIVGKAEFISLYQSIEQIFSNISSDNDENSRNTIFEYSTEDMLPVYKFKQNHFLEQKIDIYVKCSEQQNYAEQAILETLGIAFMEKFININFTNDIEENLICINQFTQSEKYIHIAIWLKQSKKNKRLKILKELKNKLSEYISIHNITQKTDDEMSKIIQVYRNNIQNVRLTKFEILRQLEDCFIYKQNFITNREWQNILLGIEEKDVYNFLTEYMNHTFFVFL